MLKELRIGLGKPYQLELSLESKENAGICIEMKEGNRYVGEVANGMRSGSGVLYIYDGSRFEGK